MTERYEPVPIPPGPLTHKNWVLPQIGTDPHPDHEGNDDLDTFVGRSFGSYRGLYEFTQHSRVEQWGKTVQAYEENPRQFGAAWRYLDAHPIFYKFRHVEDDTPLAQVLQERNLEHEYGVTRIFHRVAEWCSEQWECDDDACGHRKVDIHYMELGKWEWPSDEKEYDYLPRPGGDSYHDYELDVYGGSYEECILQVAYLVWKKYGSDRRIADKEN